MRESKYQRNVIDRIKETFPGAVVIKNDPNYIQGIPDLVVLWHHYWFMLEVKESRGAKKQPNQDYYVDLLNEMSFAAFVYPEIEDRVFYELQHTLSNRG